MQQAINVKEIETAMNQFGDVVVTKNEKNNVVVMSMEEYKKKHLREDVIEKLKQSEREIENGEGIESDIVFKELRQKYGY